MSQRTAPGRRAATVQRRLPTTALVAGALVAATVALAALVRPAPAPSVKPTPPSEAALARADVACPPQAGALRVLSLSGATGGLTRAGERGAETTIDLPASGLASDRPEAGVSVVTGRDQLAPGLIAGGTRSTEGLTALACTPPQADLWFTGVTARADRPSTLVLVNPDAGAATVDVRVVAARGEVRAADLRGLRVPGHTTSRIELADTVPRRGDLALQVVVTRGRAAALVRTSVDEPGGGIRSAEWLPAQMRPGVDNVLLGLPQGSGERSLLLANPGESEARVSVEVISEESTFAASGIEEIRVAPGGVASVRLDVPLASAVRQGALGLRVTASLPVTAALRSLVDGDLSFAVPVAELAGEGGAVLPDAPGQVERTLLLTGGETREHARVTWLAADGRALARERIATLPGRITLTAVPSRAMALRLESSVTTMRAVVSFDGRGATQVPVVAPPRSALVPAVTQQR